MMYPSDETLELISTSSDLELVLTTLERNWMWQKWGFIREGNTLELHTGGWSGNEDLIYAFLANENLTFEVDEQEGGHYFIQLP